MKHALGQSKWFSLLCMVLLFLNLVSCATFQNFLKLQKPTARIADIGLREIDLDSVTLVFDVEVENPYPVPLSLVNVDYQLASRDNGRVRADLNVAISELVDQSDNDLQIDSHSCRFVKTLPLGKPVRLAWGPSQNCWLQLTVTDPED